MTEKTKTVRQYRPTPYPIDAKKVVTHIETEDGLKVKVYSQGKATVKRYDYAPNPNLKKILQFNNLIIYQFIDTEDFVIMVHHPEKQPIWCKLENHDIETLEAFCHAYHRDFHNPIPEKIWIRKKIRQKMRNIIEKFKE